MNRIYSSPRCILFIFCLIFSFIGCGGGGGGSSNDGGGGGGGDGSITYTGRTTPATITEANAEDLVFGSLLGLEIGGSFSLNADSGGGKLVDKQGQTNSIHPIAINLPLVLNNTAKNIFYAHSKKSSSISIARTATNTINGNCGGTATYTINVNDTAGSYEGTFIFAQYCEDGIVISGGTDINGTLNLATGDIITVTYLFDNLTIDEFIYKGNVSVNDAVTPQRITLDLLVKDSALDKVYWAKEYSILVNEITATDSEIEVTGTYYDPDQGYVTVSTREPLIVSTEDWPILGIMLCIGGNNTKTKLTAISASSYRLEVDTNGDDTYDYNSGILVWPGVTGFTHLYTQITSDNRTTRGWTLKTEMGIDGISGSPQWSYGPNNTLGIFAPMNPWLVWTPPYPPIYEGEFLSGQPSDYNGFSFAWTWIDTNGSYEQTAVASGIRELPLSYSFNVVSGGEHPIFAWANDDLNFSEYRIRVLNPDTEALLYQVSLDYAQFGANPVYQITEFSFLPGVTYLLRIEARQFLTPDTYSTPDGTIPLVLNRSILLVNYIY
jgi:hypothetical protein